MAVHPVGSIDWSLSGFAVTAMSATFWTISELMLQMCGAFMDDPGTTAGDVLQLALVSKQLCDIALSELWRDVPSVKALLSLLNCDPSKGYTLV